MRKTYLHDVLSSMVIVVLFVLILIPALEPGFVRAANPSQVVTSQQITAEMSLTVSPSTVTMLPSIPGLTGGVGTGTTTITAITNNATGYTIGLTASSTGKMIGNTAGGQILAYTPTDSAIPEEWSVGANTAEFGYTVTAVNSGDVVSGSIFNGKAGGTYYTDAGTASEDILKSATSTVSSGAVASLSFRAEVTANPNPTIPSDWYVATTTLTMTMNP